MYRIAIYGITGTGTPITQFLEGEAIVQGWSKQISAAGTFTFSVPIASTKATATNLQCYRRVRLYRARTDTGKFEAVWFGFIQATKLNGELVDVECIGMLDLFRKRYCAPGAYTGPASTNAFDLLAAANDDSDTGVVAGAGGVTTSLNLNEDQYDLLRCWTDFAAATFAEFEIDDTATLNFVPSLGTDKSATVTLNFRRDGILGSNLASVEFGEDSSPLVNRIYAASTSGTLSLTQDDTASQATYGVLAEQKQWDNCADLTMLGNFAQSYLAQRSTPLTDYRVELMPYAGAYNSVTNVYGSSGLQYGDIVVGDLVQVQIVTENQNILAAKRVAQIEVAVDGNGAEQIFLTLGKAGVALTAALYDTTQLQDIKRRLREVESQL